MLLRPRKVIFKNAQKKRTINTLKYSKTSTKKLVFGHIGLKSNNPNLFIFNKHLFKLKLFLKKSVRRSNITNRYLWLSVFPHIPLTKKVIGSRMGKGKGKPSNWAAKIPSNNIMIELKNVRPGRGKHFLSQVRFKLPGTWNIVTDSNKHFNLIAFKKVNIQYMSLRI